MKSDVEFLTNIYQLNLIISENKFATKKNLLLKKYFTVFLNHF